MNRILLTGTSGQVGSALLPLLQENGKLLTPRRAEFDLSDPSSLVEALERLAPDLIVNPAAYTAVDRAEDEADLAFRVNAGAPAVLAQYCLLHDVPLVHFSTDYVFDGSGNKAWSEQNMPSPLSVYGASKLAGERAIRETGCQHLIVRTSWVYSSTGTNFMNTIGRLARDRKEIRVVADQFGAPTSAAVIAGAVSRIVRENAARLGDAFSESDGIINVACAGQTSWHGFAMAIVDGLRARGVELKVEEIIPIRTSEYPMKATRPNNSRLDLSRLEKCFGLVTKAWDDALALELDTQTDKFN